MTSRQVHSPEHNPRGLRRWFSYSLRTILALVVVCALPLAWIAKERRHAVYELDLAAKLEKQHCDVRFAGPYVNYELTLDRKQFTRDDRNSSKFLRKLLGQRIYSLSSSGAAAELRDLSCLESLRNLQSLYLHGTPVTDLTPLTRLKRLKYLGLVFTQVTDLSPLFGLPELERVNLRGTTISKAQVESLQQALPQCRIEYDPTP